MRRALIIGIDEYATSPLKGCVNDARTIEKLLRNHEDGSPNFDCRLLTAPPFPAERPAIREKIAELFAHEAEMALLYFSGHGAVRGEEGYIVTQDGEKYDEGIAMSEIADSANRSKVQEVVVLLDCCYSGRTGARVSMGAGTLLREGVSILTASRGSQLSVEIAGHGLFTNLVSAALDGGAADVLGKVTIASIYAYVDQTLGAWDQRPLFKALVSRLVPIRNCKPVVPLEILRRLPKYFVTPNSQLPLDPSFEPDLPPKNPTNEATFADLQKYRAARLVVPIGEEHMFYAAKNSKSCELTPLGQFYWELAKGNKL